ncbi:putative DNA-binding protein with PD1-like motif [Desulfitispora alkaliphila]|uniref:PPC domain-containing DNA-binding protein n=1 Tax=Desulfitispora alkaliphila TaxID=622674 RepID=UPI003D23D8DC
MKSTQGKMGRVFIIRLEEGDVLPDCLERFAKDNKVVLAQVTLIGGISKGEIVVGPRETDQIPINPMKTPVEGAHEVIGVGVLAPSSDNEPVLHIHGALGRAGQTKTGCLRPGVKTWLVGEVIMTEILGADARRVLNQEKQLELLEVSNCPRDIQEKRR